MEKYIYINYAHEDGAQVLGAIKEIQAMGINVHYGNGSEESVAKSQCVVHFCTASSHTSKSYRKIMNYTLKHEIDSILIHFDGQKITSDVETQLDVLHTLFKYCYKAAVKEQLDESAEIVLEQLEAVAEVPAVKEPEHIQEEEQPVERTQAPSLVVAEEQSEKVSESQIQPETAQPVKAQESPVESKEELYEMAVQFIEGEGEDVKLGFEYLKRAASQGHIEAQYQLSVCYDRGLGVRRDIEEAARWRQMAAYGRHVQAQTEIGYCYEIGEGVTRNYAEAVKWYEMASDQGDIQAKNNLAYCYQKGRGVAKNVKKAIQLYHDAADAGHASAQYNLAYCYWYGEGVKPDKVKAIELYEQSAANGNAKAGQMLKILKQHAFVSK